MPASLITFAHLAVSVRMIAANASGAHHIEPDPAEVLAREWMLHDVDRLFVQLRDDWGRRSHRREQPEP